jgi:hypothetical protein
VVRTLVPLHLSLYTARAAAPEPLEWRIDDRLVRWTVLTEPDAVAAQVRGLRGYLAQACGSSDGGMVAQLAATQAVLGLSAEASLSRDRAAEGFWCVAAERGGLVLDAGVVRDSGGAELCAPRTGKQRDGAQRTRPDAARAARRLRVLGAIAARLTLEERPSATLAELGALRRWIEIEGLEEALDEEAQELLFEPTLGGMGRSDRERARAEVEGAAVIGWALGVMPRPARDRAVEAAMVCAAAGVLTRCPDALARPELRALQALEGLAAELETARSETDASDTIRGRASAQRRATRWLLGASHGER